MNRQLSKLEQSRQRRQKLGARNCDHQWHLGVANGPKPAGPARVTRQKRRAGLENWDRQIAKARLTRIA